MKILETKRILLRHLEPRDLDSLHALYRDPEMRRYFPDGTLTYEQTREELEWFLNGHPLHPQLGLWATIHKPSGQFVGRCGLLPWTIEGSEEVEIAYMIAREFSGQGLGTEAAYAILHYGFEQLGLSRLICLIDPANVPSQRVADKIGMHRERLVEGIEGDNFPTLIYAISRE